MLIFTNLGRKNPPLEKSLVSIAGRLLLLLNLLQTSFDGAGLTVQAQRTYLRANAAEGGNSRQKIREKIPNLLVSQCGGRRKLPQKNPEKSQTTIVILESSADVF